MNRQALVPILSKALNWDWGCSWLPPPPTPTLLTMKESSDPFGINWKIPEVSKNHIIYFSFFSDNFGEL